MAHDYESDNERSRAGLRALVSSLSDDDLGRDAGDGWTVAMLLAHSAFWDARAAEVAQRWLDRDAPNQAPIDVQSANDGMKPLLAAVPPREAARIALEAAERVDALVARFTPALAEAATTGSALRGNRSAHRLEHLDQIERALGR
jgi:hypothetical protein